jgi:uncharacterized protein YraI
MHLRRMTATIAVCLALLLGAGQPRLIAAQDPGDQIVETDVTPTPEGDDAADAPTQSRDDDGADATAEADSDETDDPATGDDTNAATDDGDSASDQTSPFDVTPGDRMIVVEDLNLREEAETDADVIEVMPQDSVVTIAGDGEAVNDFLPVNYEEDAGWAYLPFLVHEDQEDNLAVTTGDLNLREGPSTDDDVLLVIPEGAEVRVAGLETDDGEDWNRVYYEGDLGWALAEYVEYVDEDDSATSEDDESTAESTSGPEPDLITVVDSNLRESDSPDADIIQVVPFGTYATATGEASNGFVPVSVDGVQGWLSTEVIAPAEIAAEITGETTTTSTTATGDPSDDEPRTTLADVNLLTEPREDADVIVLIPAGSAVTLTYDGYENGYIAISYNGSTGWVVADLLTP